IEHVCQPVIDEKGKFLGRRASQRDITQRKKIEKERQERFRFERLLSETSATFANLPVTNVEEEVERGLKRIVEFLGADRGSLFEFSEDSKSLDSVNSYAAPGLTAYTEDTAEQAFPWILKTLLKGKSIIWQHGEEIIADQDPKEKPSLKTLGIKSKVSVPISVGGTLRAVISLSSLKKNIAWTDERLDRIRLLGEIFANALERKKSETDAQQLRKELARVSRITTLSVLAGALAHEINQPLAAIMSNSQTAQRFLEAQKFDLEELKEILTDITADTSRASDVIQKLRAMMKKEDIEKTAINLNEVIREVVSLTTREAVDKDISIDLTLDPGLPRVLCDRVQLQQVILNLLINAFDAMIYQAPDRRNLMIRTGLFDKNNIQVAVQDEGMGIEEDKLEQIFQPFNTSKSGGIGLGLSINQSIIEAYGGRIWAENKPGHGAIFYFTLPIHE
ncbi:MAG: ATP-binding protein, partial [Candidatus Aminicenantes bacterium]